MLISLVITTEMSIKKHAHSHDWTLCYLIKRSETQTRTME